MNKAMFQPMWDMMLLRHGVGLRCVQALPPDQLDAHPIRDMRTPRELVLHMYGYLRAAAESVATGTFAPEETAALERIRTRDDLVAFARECWKAADAAFAGLGDAQLGGRIKTPWGEFTAMEMLGSIPDEYLHHRGQLYAYLRQLGVEPPFNWDFEHNEPELRSPQHV